MAIPTPHIPDTDPQVILKKKQLWSSSGGRLGRETVLELNRLNFDQHLQLHRAAAVCRSGEPTPGEPSDDPVIEMAARDGCKSAAEQMLRRIRPSVEIDLGERTLQDWEIAAQQACSQILDEERAVLEDFLSWLSLEDPSLRQSVRKGEACWGG